MTQSANQTPSANPPANGSGTAPASGGAGLEDLLKEFDQQPTTAPPKPDSTIERLAPLISWAADEMKSKTVQALNKDLDDAVSFLTDAEGLKETPKRFARGYLEAYAVENPAVQTAFQEREKNPEAWKQTLGQVKDAFVKDGSAFKGGSPRSDLEAAVASVRGSSATPPPVTQKTAVELQAMSDVAYDDYKKGLLTGAATARS